MGSTARAGEQDLRTLPGGGANRGLGRLIALELLQATLVFCLLADPAATLTKPFRGVDYAPHFYAAVHAADHLRNNGTLWGYDPFWLAGSPEGYMSLTDNKLFCVFVSLAPAGWAALVFNAVALTMLLAVPALLYAAARLARQPVAEATGGAAAAMIITFSLPHAVYFWSWGGVSFFFASVLLVPTVVLLVVTLAERSLFSKGGFAASLLALFTLYAHPGVAPLLAAGALPLLWSGRRPFAARLRDLALLGALLVLPLLSLVDASWILGPELRVSDPYKHAGFHGGVSQLVLDWWTRLVDTRTLRDGAGGLLAILPLALAGMVDSGSGGARDGQPSRIAGFAIAIVLLLSAAATYVVPSLLHKFTRIQPYRFLIPFAFFACVPAGRGMARLGRSLAAARPLAWVAALLGALIVANAVTGLLPILVLGHGDDPAESALLAFLERSTSEEDRILVESTVIHLWQGEARHRLIAARQFALLPLSLPRELLGSIATAPLAAVRYAKFEDGVLFGKHLSDLSSEALEATLGRYAISWIAACSKNGVEGLRAFPRVVEETAPAGECAIFRVRAPERSRLLEGKGSVRASLDRIEVRGATGERLVLKYHWMPGLRTEPPLPIEEAPQPGAATGFIAVRPGDRRDFVILPRTCRLPPFACAWRSHP